MVVYRLVQLVAPLISRSLADKVLVIIVSCALPVPPMRTLSERTSPQSNQLELNVDCRALYTPAIQVVASLSVFQKFSGASVEIGFSSRNLLQPIQAISIKERVHCIGFIQVSVRMKYLIPYPVRVCVDTR